MKLTGQKIAASHKGYFPFVEQGLIVEMSSAQKNAYDSGEGGELKWKVVSHYNKESPDKRYIVLVPPKMCSKTSSSALVVNSFAEAAKLKSCESDYWNKLLFNEEDHFLCGKIIEASFEKKLKICGIKGYSPNVDFYLRTADSVVAIESKYTEPTKKKKSTIKGQYKELVDKYGERVPAVNAIRTVIQDIATDHYHYLDAAQLIKHILGLVSILENDRSTIKRCKLIYLYHPIADKNKEHKEEVERFSESFKKANAELSFKAMTYKALFSNLAHIPEAKEYHERLRHRYSDDIDCLLWK